MLHNNDGPGTISGQLLQKILQRVWPAGGNPNSYDLGWFAPWPQRLLVRPGSIKYERVWRVAYLRPGRHLDLADQVHGNVVHVGGSRIARLGDEIKCPKRQRFK